MEYAIIFLLLAAGLVFLLMEIFIPSGGILGISGAAAFTGCLILAFRHSLALGVLVTVLIVILLPIDIVLGVKMFPNTPIGRWVMLRPKEKTTDADRAPADDMDKFLGREGVSVTGLRPSGVIDIDGERIDVVAEGLMIDPDRPVKVVKVDGNRLVVRESEA